MRSLGLSRSALRSLLRVLMLAVLVVLGGNGTLSASSYCCALPGDALELAEEEECCHSDSAAEEEGEEGHCPCPLPCHPGCSGHGLRALAGAVTDFVAVPKAARLDQPKLSSLRPPGPDPGDILRVPKPRRA